MKLPLISHTDPTQPLAYFNGNLITAGQYLSDVQALAQAMPKSAHALNITSNRYLFLVGLGATILNGVTSLLPSAVTKETLRQLKSYAPGFLILSDHPPEFDHCSYIDPAIHIGTACTQFDVPQIPEKQLIAQVFTSGSTGQPIPHPKTWGMLVENIRITGEKLSLKPQSTIMGTTPSQHMYGFESNILLCMLAGGILYDRKLFFPADIAVVLSQATAPVVLVTTPFHLESLLDSEVSLPKIDRIMCATAPLNSNLAQRAEQSFGCHLSEIFGSTETGQLAIRNTASTDEWQLVSGVKLHRDNDIFSATGGHLSTVINLSDHLEITGPDTFRLLGRNSDMVNIAGKRTSLAYLNSTLKLVPELGDAIFFIPDSPSLNKQARLALVHTSSTLENKEIRIALRQYIDPVFLPRTIVRATAIPRNSTGKILQSSLNDLLAASGKSS